MDLRTLDSNWINNAVEPFAMGRDMPSFNWSGPARVVNAEFSEPAIRSWKPPTSFA